MMGNEEKLMTISEAADLLKVSKASLRRWTNSGLLKSYRVGNRSERRFKLADLLAFVTTSNGTSSLLETSRNAAASAEMAEADSLGYEPRKHICTFYKSPREQWQFCRSHFLEHIGKEARIVYLYHGDSDRVINWIRSEGLDFQALQENRQLLLLSTTESYSIGGFFNTARMLEFWRNIAAEARADGIKKLLLTGEMGWANSDLPGHEQLISYEAELDQMLEFYPWITVVCQYPVYQMSGATVYDNLCAHTHVQLSDRLAPCFSPL
ncbi:MEDS domain-containing protein [Methylomicrobium sp. RS1]|jgi:excisionase family DNA binding protein|uniref:MEDS domain-containing protein n=1 Tax=Candidatus Methylomicrobium oryzae TaxID=2802053 RepID=UPI00192154DE|nr:MEDS domain-containing protein [Methylomicrobium sp. RS1]MBL1266061.1 MEDS domain-containing protein [Methylomicrobium sp. RS1]